MNKLAFIGCAVLVASVAPWSPSFGDSMTYMGTGSASFQESGPVGSGVTDVGNFAGTVTLEYAGGVLSLVSDTLTTTSGTHSLFPPFGQPPVVTDLTGSAIDLSGSTLPYQPDPFVNPICGQRGLCGVGIQLKPQGWGTNYFSDVFQTIPPPTHQIFSGLTITGTEEQLINGTATIDLAMRLVNWFPIGGSGMASLHLTPIPEPHTLCYGLIGAALCCGGARRGRSVLPLSGRESRYSR